MGLTVRLATIAMIMMLRAEQDTVSGYVIGIGKIPFYTARLFNHNYLAQHTRLTISNNVDISSIVGILCTLAINIAIRSFL